MTKVRAFECEVGDQFRWKDETFIVLKEYDDKNDHDSLIVRNMRSNYEVPFNPYTYVEKLP